MKLDIAFKEIDATEAIQNHVRERAKKIERYIATDEHVRVVVCAKMKGQQHSAEIFWHCNNLGKDFHAHSEGHNLYTQIDEMFEKVSKQVQNEHDRQIDKRRHAEPHKKMPV